MVNAESAIWINVYSPYGHSTFGVALKRDGSTRYIDQYMYRYIYKYQFTFSCARLFTVVVVQVFVVGSFSHPCLYHTIWRFCQTRDTLTSKFETLRVGICYIDMTIYCSWSLFFFFFLSPTPFSFNFSLLFFMPQRLLFFFILLWRLQLKNDDNDNNNNDDDELKLSIKKKNENIIKQMTRQHLLLSSNHNIFIIIIKNV